MIEQDVSKFAVLIAGIGEVYDKTFTPAVIEIYWSVLKSFKFDEVKNAVRKHFANPDSGKYLPKPADIIMAIDGSQQNQALLAWTKASYAAQRVGRYTSVTFDDALIHAVIEDMGGWWRFCSKDDRSAFIAKEFQDRYRNYITNKPIRHLKRLAGIIESQSSYGEYSCDTPVLIGDKNKANQVFATGKYVALLDTNQFLEADLQR